MSAANTTNPVTVAVLDNGLPPLSATGTFSLIVNPTVPPSLALSRAAFPPQLLVHGQSGPDYTLLASTNLSHWDPLLTSNSPALPWIVADPDAPLFPTRFYRVAIGP